MIDNTHFQHIKVETTHLDQCEEILDLVNDATKISGSVTYVTVCFWNPPYLRPTLLH